MRIKRLRDRGAFHTKVVGRAGRMAGRAVCTVDQPINLVLFRGRRLMDKADPGKSKVTRD